MRARLRWKNAADPNQPAPLFTGIPQGPRTIWATFPGSAVVQFLVVWLGASYLHFLATMPPLREVRILEDRVLEIAFDPARKLEAPAPLPAQGGSQPGKRSPAKRASQARSGTPSEASPSAPAPALQALREFQMPAVRSKRPVPQTLVQLDLPPTLDLHQQLRVPAFILLSGVTPAKPPTRQFLAPPDRANTTPVPAQVALDLRPPILDVQSGRTRIPDVLKENPRLPAPVGAKAPVAIFHEPAPPAKHAATITAELPAPPANIVSLPDRPIPLGSAIVLPPINQISPRDSGFGEPGSQGATGFNTRPNESGSGGDASVVSQSEAGNGNQPGSPGRSGGQREARGSGTGAKTNGAGNSAEARAGNAGGPGGGSAGAGSGVGAAVAGLGSGPDGKGSGRSTGPGAGDRTGGSVGAGGSGDAANGTGGNGTSNVRSASAPSAARVVRPIEGNYEVAIVQSSGSVPGSSGLLNGRPVYSVYISVGDGKEWILQYCLPADEKQRSARSQVVQLGGVTPLSAPYAFVILRPNVRFRSGSRYGFVHAYVSAAGRFDRMTEVGEPAIENIEAVLESLQQWEFRPAAKDGAPAIVEVLLCIPNA